MCNGSSEGAAAASGCLSVGQKFDRRPSRFIVRLVLRKGGGEGGGGAVKKQQQTSDNNVKC